MDTHGFFSSISALPHTTAFTVVMDQQHKPPRLRCGIWSLDRTACSKGQSSYYEYKENPDLVDEGRQVFPYAHRKLPLIAIRLDRLADLMRHHYKSLLQRLFYVAKISQEQTSPTGITDHYEQLFHKLVKSRLEEPVSGLLLIYPSFLIHIIESTSEILNAILQDLVQMQKPNGKCLLLNSRILVMSHNVPCRLFTQWYFRVIIWPVIYLHDAAEGQPVMTLVEDCLTLLMKLAVYLSEILQPGNNGPGENLYELVPNLLVREEIVCALIQSNELLTPEQYLRMYQGPLNSANDSGEAWTIVQDHFL